MGRWDERHENDHRNQLSAQILMVARERGTEEACELARERVRMFREEYEQGLEVGELACLHHNRIVLTEVNQRCPDWRLNRAASPGEW